MVATEGAPTPIAGEPPGTKGVRKRPSGRYAAVMSFQGTKLWIGTFDTEEEATIAYQEASQRRDAEKHTSHAATASSNSVLPRKRQISEDGKSINRHARKQRQLNDEELLLRSWGLYSARAYKATSQCRGAAEKPGDISTEELETAHAAVFCASSNAQAASQKMEEFDEKKSTGAALTQDLRKARQEIKMLLEINVRLQEYNTSLHQYTDTLQASAVKDGETITRLQNEKNSMVEDLNQSRREKEELLNRNIELERQQDANQRLELEIERLKGELMAMSKMDEDLGAKKKIEELNRELNDKTEDLDFLSSDYETLVVREHMGNNVIQEVHKALITGLRNTQSGCPTLIGIKRMGEINFKPFHNACKEKFPKDEAELKAAELWSKWQEEVRVPAWHPYKVIHVDGKHKEIIKEEDTKLEGLKNELGEEVRDAVAKSLLEMNEYNPSGRFVVPELWHFKENRKASPGEVVAYLFRQLKTHKRR